MPSNNPAWLVAKGARLF